MNVFPKFWKYIHISHIIKFQHNLHRQYI